jgi:hypothetical protein
MKNINSLIQKEVKLYDDVLAGKVDPEVAAEANNAAGKIIGACKVQIEYAAARNEKPEIPFLKK